MATKVFSAYVDQIKTNQDKSVRITITTQEMDGNELGGIYDFQGKLSKFMITDNNVLNSDSAKAVESTKLIGDKKTKSQSSRLRNVLFILWQQIPDGFDNFEDFYTARMEALISQIKDRLEN